MPTSPHPDPLPWADLESATPGESLGEGREVEVEEPYADQLFDQEAPDRPRATTPREPGAGEASAGGPAPAADSRGAATFDDEIYAAPSGMSATEYATAPGMPARGVIVLSSATALGCAAVDFALTGRLSIFFDLCFVTVCLVGAMAVRRRDLFTAGVLAPLVLAGVIAVIGFMSPQTFAAAGGISRVFLSGLAQHAGALVAGYGVALATVAGRVSASRAAPAP